MENIFEKTRVAFGRTELSLRLSCTEFCALSPGHGPRVLGFQGGSSRVDFHVSPGSSRVDFGVKNPRKNSLNFLKKRSPLTIGKWFLRDLRSATISRKNSLNFSKETVAPDHWEMIFA